jgi:hypothetical protein
MKAKTCWPKGKHVTPQGSGYYEKSTPEGSHVYRIYRQGHIGYWENYTARDKKN